jgi:hypothetical protein
MGLLKQVQPNGSGLPFCRMGSMNDVPIQPNYTFVYEADFVLFRMRSVNDIPTT